MVLLEESDSVPIAWLKAPIEATVALSHVEGISDSARPESYTSKDALRCRRQVYDIRNAN